MLVTHRNAVTGVERGCTLVYHVAREHTRIVGVQIDHDESVEQVVELLVRAEPEQPAA